MFPYPRQHLALEKREPRSSGYVLSLVTTLRDQSVVRLILIHKRRVEMKAVTKDSTYVRLHAAQKHVQHGGFIGQRGSFDRRTFFRN